MAVPQPSLRVTTTSPCSACDLLPPTPIRLCSSTKLGGATATASRRASQCCGPWRASTPRLSPHGCAPTSRSRRILGYGWCDIIKAFQEEEAEIPIDMVGGASIESFVGGIYAREMDSELHGAGQVTVIQDDERFAMTTNIMHLRTEIYLSGYMWLYILASMTLVGFMPPICDEDRMLVDGGYINNLPSDVMRSLRASTIVAVDVSVADHTEPVTLRFQALAAAAAHEEVLRLVPAHHGKVVEAAGGAQIPEEDAQRALRYKNLGLLAVAGAKITASVAADLAAAINGTSPADPGSLHLVLVERPAEALGLAPQQPQDHADAAASVVLL
ncbi:phosphatidylcholine and lysophosphatidylcholine phospholipase [Cladochytrium tenue]|nr:phosphatidylcholine and lysophosphatidylcholine phospholipase [Cladochytrium tenue]